MWASFRELFKQSYNAITGQQITHNQSHQKHWEETNKVLAGLHPKPEEKAAHEASQERRHSENLATQRILTVGTWLAFIAAAIYAWVAASQLTEMRKATEEARHQLTESQNTLDTEMRHFDRTMDQTISQTSSQNLSAKATKKAADTSTEALVKVQRAFINPLMHYDVTSDPTTGELASSATRLNWENAGVTPARHFTSHSSHRLQQEPPDIYQELWPPGTDLKSLPKPIFTYVAAKGTVYGRDTIVLSAEELKIMSQNHLAIYMWGWAKYYDVFPMTKRHITRYCFRVTFAPIAANGKQTGYTESPENCDEGNCADEDCKVQ